MRTHDGGRCVSDENAEDEVPEYSWNQIRELAASSERGNLVLALNDARRHLVWFARVRGLRVGHDGERHWGLPSAVMKLARDGIITEAQSDKLCTAIDIRDDEIHRNRRPSSDELARAVLSIVSVCAPPSDAAPSFQTRPRVKQPPPGIEVEWTDELWMKCEQSLELWQSTNPLRDPILWWQRRAAFLRDGDIAQRLTDPVGYETARKKKEEEASERREQERLETERRREQQRRVQHDQAKAAEEMELARKQREAEADRQRQRRDTRNALVAVALTPVMIVAVISFKRMMERRSGAADPEQVTQKTPHDARDAETPARRGSSQETGPSLEDDKASARTFNEIIDKRLTIHDRWCYRGKRGCNDNKLCDIALEKLGKFTEGERLFLKRYCDWE